MHREKKHWAIVVVAVAALATALLTIGSASANLSGSTFEGNDGNLVVNGGAGAHDWVNAPNRVIGTDLPTGTTDNSFGQGTKEDSTAVTVVSGSIPNNKADLSQFYVANEQAGGHTFLYLGWTRANTGGTTNFDFEVNKLAQPDLTTPGPKTLVRSTGDLLVNYLFQGQGTPQIAIRTWTGSVWSSPVDASAFSEAAINSGGAVANPLPGATDPTPVNQFGETAINLSAGGIIPPGVCEAFGSAYVKSRSSTAFNSEIKDFIAPVHVSINTCANVSVLKLGSDGGSQAGAVFTLYEGSDTTGTVVGTCTVAADGTCTDPSFSGLNPGTYTFDETTTPAGYDKDPTLPFTFTLAANQQLTLTFTDPAKPGALKIVKNSTKGGPVSQAGAVFSYDSNSVTDNGAGDEDPAVGSVCVSGLAAGSYSVQETAAPSFYGLVVGSAQSVTVEKATNCTDNLPGAGATATFTDPPLSDIQVNFRDGGSLETSATITCDNTTGTSDSTAATGWDSSLTVTGVQAPTTVHCTITIDP
jgi:Prealbumin-like fold domain